MCCLSNELGWIVTDDLGAWYLGIKPNIRLVRILYVSSFRWVFNIIEHFSRLDFIIICK